MQLHGDHRQPQVSLWQKERSKRYLSLQTQRTTILSTLGRPGFALAALADFLLLATKNSWLKKTNSHQNETRHMTLMNTERVEADMAAVLCLRQAAAEGGAGVNRSTPHLEPTAPAMQPHPKVDCPVSHGPAPCNTCRLPQNNYWILGIHRKAGRCE